ncbi:MAG: hypothetical protein R3C19_20445 [Planctomycetaceae bacterium]
MADWSDYFRLIAECETLGYGPARTAVLEQAVQLADTLGDRDAQYDTRMLLVAAASFGGAGERALVAFTWCLNEFDSSPERRDEHQLLWAFKWILGSLPDFVTVPRSRIEAVQNDFEARLKQFGHGLAPLYKLKCRNAIDLGDVDDVRRWHSEWRTAPGDSLQDCPACQTSAEGRTLLFLGRMEDGLRALEPILSGRQRCHSVPGATYATILRPLTLLGRDDEAKRYHRLGYRAVSRNPDFLSSVAAHLVYAVRLKDTDQASRMFQKHLPVAMDVREDDMRREFLVASWIFLEHLAAVSRRRRKLVLPQGLECVRDDSLYEPAELATWFQTQAAGITRQFDERNGNDFYTRKMHRLSEFALGKAVDGDSNSK